MPLLKGRKIALSVAFDDPFGVPGEVAFSNTLQLDTAPVQRRIAFKATKTWKPTPNTCEVKIWNLSPDQRAAISKAKTPTIKLAAGYEGDPSLTQIFFGQAIFVKHEIANKVDVITTISTTDGGERKQQARVNVSFGRGTSTSTVLKEIVRSLGISPGNLDRVAKAIDKGIYANIYLSGTVVSGAAADELSHLCRATGYDWSIQDGALQMLKVNAGREDFDVDLSPDTGLVNSPSISNKGVVSGQCLIFKERAGLDLVPGRLIKIKSAFLSGQFLLAKCEYAGDNYVEDWLCSFEAVAKKGDLVQVK